MAVTENFFTGDGSTTSYVLTFEYIDEDDVKVSLDGSVTTAYSFANATTILFDTAPASDVAIRIYRDTDIDELKSTFFAGSSIRAQDLNKNFEQNNFAVQEIKNYTWDNETDTIHSDETWVSSDTQIATTAAMDQRFQDEAAETIESGETWVSDDDHIATTAAIDARFQDELSETITSSETWPNNDDTIATTAAIDDRIDLAITNDIGTDGTGITITDDGDGTITLGLGSGSIDLDRIKDADIVTSAEANPNNDTTIATTAKIDDMIDAAITGDIAVDSTGLSVTDDGDGTITLGIAAGSVDLDRIKAGDIITQAEQNADYDLAGDDDSIFTSSAAIRRFENFVQNDAPSGTGIGTGRMWLDVEDDLTLSVWNGSAWTAVSSGGTFTEQPNVVYVDASSGSDDNDGHRISRPKLTIEAAINQINDDIDVELTSGGSGYGEGTYNTVSLTGGTGTGLTANITVNASGVVSAVTLNSRTPLVDSYYIGDVLSADAADLGGSGSGLQITVTGDGDGQIVVVAAGVYQEAAPIQIKRRNVSIIGQALRSCLVHPTAATETNSLFELNSGSYISSLTLTGVKAGTGTGNTLDAVLPTTQGWNFAFYDNAFITKSPYIQNCTNFSDSEIDNDDLNAHNPAGGQAGDTDSAPTGGGLLVNGATPHDDSPLRSMVADSYTHVALNGPGILVTNNGYTQITSSYAFFNRYHIKCLNGGQANLAASTTDFGDQALVADGRSTTAIFTAALSTAASDQDITFTIDAPTADASWHGSETRPQSNMLVELNSITYPILSATANGGGWDVTISRPDPNNRSNNLGLNGAVATPATASFFLRSQIASSGHTMEYVGSGTNYSALPENGGVPDEADQIVELNNGKVWTAITDHNGKFKIGGNQTTDPIFQVDQQLGFVTIPEGSIAFNLVADTTPQLGGDLDVNGNEITSASNGNVVINPNGTGNIVLDANVGIGTASASTLLHLKANAPFVTFEDDNDNQDWQVRATSRFNLYDATNSSERLAVDSSGRLLVGTSASRSVDNEKILQIEGTSQQTSSMSLTRNSNSSGPPNISFGKSRGTTTGSNTIVQNGDELGIIVFCGADGTDSNSRAASISGVVDGTPGSNDMPGRLVFSTTAATASSPTERMRIDSSGRVGIGTTSPGVTLEVDGGNSGFTGEGAIRLRSDGGGSTNGSVCDITSVGTGTNDSALAFSTRSNAGGITEKARIDSSGRLLVGASTAPNLQTNANLQLIHSDGAQLIFARNDTDTTTNEDIGLIRFYGNDSDGNYDECARIAVEAESAHTSTSKPTFMRFFTNGGSETVTERMRIDSSGNVGIGTSSPSGNLTVNLSSTDKNITFSGVQGEVGSVPALVAHTNAGALKEMGFRGVDLRFACGSAERARIDSSGRLLVGTTSARSNFAGTTVTPHFQIEGTGYDSSSLSLVRNVNSGGNGEIILGKTRSASNGGVTIVSNGDTLGGIRFDGADGSDFATAALITASVDDTPGANDMPGRLVFSTNSGTAGPTERMRITRNGNVFVNATINPALGTEMFGVAAQGSGQTTAAGFSNSVNTAPTLFISNTSDTTNTYHVRFASGSGGNTRGEIYYNGSQLVYATSSDYRLKENVEPLSSGVDLVKQLRPVSYRWIESQQEDVGFIAHEVQEIFPNAVGGDKDAVDENGAILPQTYDPSKLVPLLTAALQEALAEIESLKARVTALEP